MFKTLTTLLFNVIAPWRNSKLKQKQHHTIINSQIIYLLKFIGFKNPNDMIWLSDG